MTKVAMTQFVTKWDCLYHSAFWHRTLTNYSSSQILGPVKCVVKILDLLNWDFQQINLHLSTYHVTSFTLNKRPMGLDALLI